MSLHERWSTQLDALKQQGRFRAFALPKGIDFTSNDYLGYGSGRLAQISRNESPSHNSLARSGMSSRLLRGHHAIWEEVETALAQWHNSESVLMMSSGYTANEGLLSTICEPADWVACDELCHACIIDGLRLARSRRFAYRHNDLNHLEEGLKAETAKRNDGRERFIITEALFSMDGDRAPVREIVQLGDRYGAHVIFDEAHSTGCFGPGGSGCVDESGVRDRILASVHPGGKALGVPGAYIAGSTLLKDYLINRCRHLIFTTAMPSLCGTWWLEMLPNVRADQNGRQALFELSVQFRAELQRRGIEALGSHYVVPIVLGNDSRAVQVARNLQKSGFDIRAIRPPSVPPGTSRLRISIHANHDASTLKELADVIAREYVVASAVMS